MPDPVEHPQPPSTPGAGVGMSWGELGDREHLSDGLWGYWSSCATYIANVTGFDRVLAFFGGCDALSLETLVCTAVDRSPVLVLTWVAASAAIPVVWLVSRVVAALALFVVVLWSTVCFSGVQRVFLGLWMVERDSLVVWEESGVVLAVWGAVPGLFRSAVQ